MIRLLIQELYEWPTTDRPKSASSPDIDIMPVTDDNVERILDFRGVTQESIFRRYLEQGHRGVFAIRDGRVVGHAWLHVAHRDKETVNRYFRLRSNEALIHYCNVDKTARGQGIYGAMLAELVRETLAASPKLHILIDTSRKNTSSVRGIVKAGFTFRARALYFLLGPRLIVRWQRN